MKEMLLVIPAYNEQENIEQVVNDLTANYPQLDYVIINDGSTDQTAAICRRNRYNFVDLSINLGLAGAFQTGMKYAHQFGYRYAVQFDGDGQHRPEYIEQMRKKMDQGFDIVIASRYLLEKKPRSLRMLGSNLIGMAIRFTTGIRVQDPTSGMRMFNRKAIEAFAFNLNYGPEPDTISYLLKQGARVAEIQVVMDERIGGVSYLTPWNASKYMLRMLASILIIQCFRRKDTTFQR